PAAHFRTGCVDCPMNVGRNNSTSLRSKATLNGQNPLVVSQSNHERLSPPQFVVSLSNHERLSLPPFVVSPSNHERIQGTTCSAFISTLLGTSTNRKWAEVRPRCRQATGRAGLRNRAHRGDGRDCGISRGQCIARSNEK